MNHYVRFVAVFDPAWRQGKVTAKLVKVVLFNISIRATLHN